MQYLNTLLINRWFYVQTIIPSIKSHLSNLKSKIQIDANSFGTLALSSAIQLQRFETLEFQISSETSQEYEVQAGSTISLIVVGECGSFTIMNINL